MTKLIPLLTAALFATPALDPRPDPAGPGDVRLPLPAYTNLVDRARDPKELPRPAPAPYALGKATVIVSISDSGPKATAEVKVDLSARVFADEWVWVPLLASGTAVSAASVGGNAVQLVASASGLGWSVNQMGSYELELRYAVDAIRSAQGFAVGVPVPQAAAITLTATLPGSGLDVAVIPAAGMKTTTRGNTTTVTANIPTTSGVHVSWRPPTDHGHAISRAHYTGSLSGDAVTWTAALSVELFSDETVTLPLVPASTTLNDIRVDRRAATILVDEDETFATLIKGRGSHEVAVTFQVPVLRGDGPPRVELAIPEIPVSRFELTLPGKKEVSVEPAASVTNTPHGGTTVATVNVPMTAAVAFTWSEAVPEAIKAELRANADIYHLVHAEEGVLYVRAMTVFEVTRGQSNVLEVEVPAGVQVNDVRAAGGGVSEWIPKPSAKGRPQRVSVFLDREVKGRFEFDVYYERKLQTGKGAEQQSVEVPVTRAAGVNRQRGMIALLASKELTLEPKQEEQVTRVGENQLPAFVRQVVEKTVAHTYKYVEAAPKLTVQPAPPEHKAGKFDAQVDTLISLGDVTIKGSATVEISVKSGGIMDLQLGLPKGVNFLSLTAPSKRTHEVKEGDAEQLIDVQFTQEMEGQFRVDVTYEKIMTDSAGEVRVPTLNVKGAEVEQGRIAIEALAAVEVRDASTQRPSSLDINELPQQLILETTNPILLAYKYVQPAPPLSLRITRHREIDVQAAAIDSAHYRTLYTRDGLAVTIAKFIVRNSRKQFLRMHLPEGSRVWSAFVAGKAEKPAIAGAVTDPAGGVQSPAAAGDDAQSPTPKHPAPPAEDVAPNILIKIINSSDGFPVEVVYETPVAKIGTLGTIEGQLARPDMIVTNSVWEVYFPDGISYGTPDTNMEVVDEGTTISGDEMGVGVAADTPGGQRPLHIDVPTSGVRYTFRKVYANRSDEEASFSLSYASAGGAWVPPALGILGTLSLWLGLILLWRRRLGGQNLWRSKPAGIALGGGLALILASYFGVPAALPVIVSLLVGASYGIKLLAARVRDRNSDSARA